MVTQYGMSDKLGPISFGNSNNEVFLGKDWGQTRNYSEEVASVIDTEVESVIDECYKESLRLLEENSSKLDLVAKALLEFEKIDGETFEKLFNSDKKEESAEDVTE